MINVFYLNLLLLFVGHLAVSQNNEVIIKGTVLSDDNLQPLPFAHIVIDSTGTTSNIYGNFNLKIAKTDTLHFSYIGYKKKSYVIPDSISSDEITLEIILLKDITFLRAVTVTSLPATLDDLKEELMATEVPIEVELEHAKKSIELATYQYLYMKSFKLNMDAYDNHAMFLRGNEGLNPAGGNVKGMLKFLRNRVQGKPLEGTYEHYKYYQKNKDQ
ncbi:MAG: carboxypeptidase-like regulatory domain-containing protein [Cyclobacteriaceae bacterium]|nr:carboxypeptidase-like regulatory domain-containing protein [Cyclobacteriaceae bacterium]